MTADILQLDPKLQPLCAEFLRKCSENSIDARVTITYRSPAEQQALIDKKITTVSPGKDKHCCEIDGQPASQAFDFAIYKNNNYVTNGTDPLYTQAGKIAQDLGLVWGGNFVHPRPDYDHIQLK